MSNEIKPWKKLEALENYFGEKILYKPKEIKKLESPDLVTVACLPAEYTWVAEKLGRKLSSESNYDLFDRLDALKFVHGVYPESKIVVILADDDWKYVFTDNYEPELVEWHQLNLQSKLQAEFEKVEVKTVSELTEATGLDYVVVQMAILKILASDVSFSQLPGWLKAISTSVEEKTIRKVNEAGGEVDADAIEKIAKQQIGMAIQGMALRSFYLNADVSPFYLGMYGDVQRFWDMETKVMMESNLPSLGWVGGLIPAVYCSEGSIDTDLLENMVAMAGGNAPQEVSAKRNKSTGGKNKGKSCDDVLWA